ncbi:MAG: hypothetical protein E6G01_08770 [Actinobacteria bacterium]|nr:MAG: hypothetical protein E6G01_08770 [Actinomycetota bacterium]
MLTTTARATGPLDPDWLCGAVVLVGGRPVVWGTAVVVVGAAVRGRLLVVVVAGALVVVVLGGVVVAGVVVGGADVVEVVDEGGAGSAAAASLPTLLSTAIEPRQLPRTSAMVSPEAEGRSRGLTRRTDMDYPLVRSIESLSGAAVSQPGGSRDSTGSPGAPVSARLE